MSVLDPSASAVIARARGVADAALDQLRPRLLASSGRVEVSPKADGTPVTEIDHEIDARLAEEVTTAFPSHGVISEERETRAPTTDWAWIVDPIDGTSNFIAGLPYWCVSIALALEGVPVLGFVDAPVLDRRYLAVRGSGAERDGRSLRVRAPVDWRDGRYGYLPVMLTTGTARRARPAGLRLNPRVMGSTALDLAMVAEGVAVASVAVRPYVWDIAAGALLVEEAGGAVTTVGADPLLPLRPGAAYGRRTAPTAAAADGAYARDLATALLPQG